MYTFACGLKIECSFLPWHVEPKPRSFVPLGIVHALNAKHCSSLVCCYHARTCIAAESFLLESTDANLA